MAFKSLGGKDRRYLNTATGETISRRQYQNLMKGVSFEEKARRNKEADLKAALARPARGRTKAVGDFEAELRLKNAEIKAEREKAAKLDKKAKAAAKRVKVKKIRPQLLKGGHRAERVSFTTWDEFDDLRKQMRTIKAPNGKRLISSYGVGIVGYDERTGREIGATLVTLQSPAVKISEDELEEMTEDFVSEKSYFIFSHYYVHLHFDTEYAEKRAQVAKAKKRGK